MSSKVLEKINNESLRKGIPDFRPGDTVKVYSKIIEGTKERIQVFQGVVIKRHCKSQANASFTVRKVSFNVGVERTFLLHSPRIEKIEVVTQGQVRRARLFYLRPLRGKAARIKSHYGTIEGGLVESPAADANGTQEAGASESVAAVSEPASGSQSSA